MKPEISNEEIQQLLEIQETDFQKYVSPIINLANRFAQGTRPKVVGKLSDLIKEFPRINFDEWFEWYQEKNLSAIENAANKIYEMIKKFKIIMEEIDIEVIRKWVGDLVLVKTFIGLRFQEAIIKKLALIKALDYKIADKEDEAKGIDGYVGNTPVSIKPITYKNKPELLDNINTHIIFYNKKKNTIEIEFNF
ncbi:MAG: MjaI family restriction endonuclease [Melioribacter sp.]|uniref:MjaI family restriction endonuclease n=1 Tax=Rosettibacter primus TaxID=3111523 RepID=UPI00247C38EB|nr:MjaI family restriction endonuclease [Melioribacter sp.]